MLLFYCAIVPPAAELKNSSSDVCVPCYIIVVAVNSKQTRDDFDEREVSLVTHADNVLPQLPPPIVSRDSVRIFMSASGYLHFHERHRGTRVT